MNLTIIAATGGVGQHLLQQAVAAGHKVTVVVRTPAKLPEGLPIRAVALDLSTADPTLLQAALDGSDAVVSGLGPVPSAPRGIATDGTRAVVTAMRAVGTFRIVAVSAAPTGTVPSLGRPNPSKHDPGDGLVMRLLLNPMLKAALRTHYADLAGMEDVLRASGLDWTISRPPKLRDGPLTGAYRTANGRNIKGGWSISRADVAHQMLHALNQPNTIRQTIGMASGRKQLRP